MHRPGAFITIGTVFIDDKVYYDMVRSLNEKQRFLHKYIYHWCNKQKSIDITKEEVKPFYVFLYRRCPPFLLTCSEVGEERDEFSPIRSRNKPPE